MRTSLLSFLLALISLWLSFQVVVASTSRVVSSTFTTATISVLVTDLTSLPKSESASTLTADLEPLQQQQAFFTSPTWKPRVRQLGEIGLSRPTMTSAPQESPAKYHRPFGGSGDSRPSLAKYIIPPIIVVMAAIGGLCKCRKGRKNKQLKEEEKRGQGAANGGGTGEGEGGDGGNSGVAGGIVMPVPSYILPRTGH